MKNDIYLKKMGDRIRNIRNDKKLSLRKLGELCDIDYGHLSRLENGQMNPYLLTLKTIADALKVDVKDFI